jgi:hypothetical protein
MKSSLLRPTLLFVAALAFAGGASAQTVSPEKQKLVDKVLTLWHAEDTAVAMIQRPAVEAMQQARIALQGRVTQAKQEAALKDMATDAQKYVDEATPIVRDNAMRLKPQVIGPLLAQNFSEDELRQLIAMLESPVKKKFETLVPSMEKAYGEKIASDSRAKVDPKLQAMTTNIAGKLRAATVNTGS